MFDRWSGMLENPVILTENRPAQQVQGADASNRSSKRCRY